MEDAKGGREGNPSTGALLAPNIRKFRPFTMNLMTNVSILFADIAGKLLNWILIDVGKSNTQSVCLIFFNFRLHKDVIK